MAKDVAKLAAIARDYLKADDRRLPDSRVLEIVNNVIEEISSGTTVLNDVTVVGLYTRGYQNVFTGQIYTELSYPGQAIETRVVYTYNEEGEVFMTAVYNEETYTPVPYPVLGRPPDAKEVLALYTKDADTEKKTYLTYLKWSDFETLANSDYASSSDSIEYWTIADGNKMPLFPEPTEILPVYCVYQRRSAEITSVYSTNYYLESYWPLIQYGVLARASIYLNEPPMISLYLPLYEKMLTRFMVEQSRNTKAQGRPISKIPDTANEGVV